MSSSSTGSGPPTAREEATYAVLRALVRAFYPDPAVVVMDALVFFSRKSSAKNRQVLESELRSNILLAQKTVRETLLRFQRDQLIDGVARTAGGEVVNDDLSLIQAGGKLIKGREKRTKIRFPQKDEDFSWWIDSTHLVKATRFRLGQMHTRLSTKADKSEMYYHCPSADCPERGRNIPLFELLTNYSTKSDEWRCLHCKTYSNNKAVGVPLVLTAATKDHLSGGNEKILQRFNKQLEHITRLTDTLHACIEHHRQATQQAHREMMGAPVNEKEERTQEFIKEVQSLKEQVTVTVGPAPTWKIREETKKLKIANEPLPWDRLAQEKRAEALRFDALSKQKELEEQLRRTEEERAKLREERFHVEKRRMMQQWEAQEARRKQQQQPQNSDGSTSGNMDSVSTSDNVMEDDDQLDCAEWAHLSRVQVNVQGLPRLFLLVSQQDLDAMTEAEFAQYSALARETRASKY